MGASLGKSFAEAQQESMKKMQVDMQDRMMRMQMARMMAMRRDLVQ